MRPQAMPTRRKPSVQRKIEGGGVVGGVSGSIFHRLGEEGGGGGEVGG